MMEFKLTKFEKLQLLNLCPRHEVDVYLIVDECEERFTGMQVERMLDILAETLPSPSKKEVHANGIQDEEM